MYWIKQPKKLLQIGNYRTFKSIRIDSNRVFSGQGKMRFEKFFHLSLVVELGGLEPPTSSMPLKRSPR